MSNQYQIYGAEVSPYSVKIRSYFRYKEIPHRWIVRNAATQSDFKKHAKLPLIPLVVAPDGNSLQDSTPIIEKLEQSYQKPSIQPDDPTTAFISTLIEEFGDEWGNKWMFHMRWARPVDQNAASGRIARTMMPDTDENQHIGVSTQIKERMVGRVWFVGSNENTSAQIEQSFSDTIQILNQHLATRSYLFGERPALGDLGLWGQLYEAWSDPTAGALIEGRAPHLLDWIHRMLWPNSLGEFEAWSSLEKTLLPFIKTQIGELFLPWSVANEKAIANGEDGFSVELAGKQWNQKPQKYHAKSLAVLREKYQATSKCQALDDLLQRTSCLNNLVP